MHKQRDYFKMLVSEIEDSLSLFSIMMDYSTGTLTCFNDIVKNVRKWDIARNDGEHSDIATWVSSEVILKP